MKRALSYLFLIASLILPLIVIPQSSVPKEKNPKTSEEEQIRKGDTQKEPKKSETGKSEKERVDMLRKLLQQKVLGISGEGKEVSVMVQRVRKVENFREVLPVLGTITPFEQVKLSFPERGVIKNLYVDEGMTVENGDLLGELQEREFVLKKDFAQSRYESEQNLYLSMKKEYSIKKSLFEKGAILKEKLEELELKIKAQQNKANASMKELELAGMSLERIKLLSPCDGKIDKQEAEEGEFVSQEVKVFTIVKINNVFAEVGITERDIPKIKKGQIAEIHVDAYPDKVFTGRITSFLPSLETLARTLKVKITIDNKKYDYLLFPNMFLRGDLILADVEDTFVVSTEALIKNPAGDYSLLILEPEENFTEEELSGGKAKGKITLRNVIPLFEGELYSAVMGVDEGEFVVLRSEGEVSPNSIGRIINVEEYEEQ